MLQRALFAAFALVILALPARAEPRVRESFENAVDSALKYLAQSQNPDGSWNAGMRFGGGGTEAAVTGLCVMAFLSAGHVPGEGPYSANIEKGVRYVCSQQQRNGLFSSQFGGTSMMYSHGICTLMVAEVVGLMPDRKEANALRERLVAAVQLIRSAQCPVRGDQGWRYQLQVLNSDMSVTGWQIMALRAAKNVGCDVPNSVIDNAVEYIKNSRAPGGGYRYTVRGNITVPCTGAAVLALELIDKTFHNSPDAKDSAQFVTDQIRRSPDPRFQQHFFYGVYYTSQAMFQVGGRYWSPFYRDYLHWLLTNKESPANQQPGGFWNAISNDDRQAGVNYCTAMAVLSLTVEYRFLPIYQRGEEPEEREGK
jgi:prenyltransferase beta subunit